MARRAARVSVRWAGAWGVACVLLFGASLVIGLGACSNDLDALYGNGVVKEADASSTKDESLPLLPALPDEANKDACETCAKQECATERANCSEDDDCVAMLACKGKCSDPGCLQTCDAEFPHSAWFEDLWKCVFNVKCDVQCDSGKNFACAGNYKWPVGDDSVSSFPVTVHFKPGQGFLAGATVLSCRGTDSDCTAEDAPPSLIVDSGVLDSMNAVKLTWWPGQGSYLVVEDERIPPFGLHERIVWPEPAEKMDLWIDISPEDLIGDWGGSPEQHTRAPLAIYARDCLLSDASGVRVEVLGGPERDAALEVEDHDSVPWFVLDVAEADRPNGVVVRMVEDASDEVLAESEALPFAGWNTHVVLLPNTR